MARSTHLTVRSPRRRRGSVSEPSGDSPWASGPGEVLRHGVSLIEDDTPMSRRLAMIVIDNAVELTLKTFLTLPAEITGCQPIDAERFIGFPPLLLRIRDVARDRLTGV